MNCLDVRRPARPRAAFTLLEALVSISITAIAASVLLLGIQSSVETTDESLKQTVALGMAQQLLDEIVGARYHALGVGGYQIEFGPSAYEQGGVGRERYDDIDDFHKLILQPPEDRWGFELGTGDGEADERHPQFFAPAGFFDGWRQEVEVYYVDPSDLTLRLPYGQMSDYRAVEVRVLFVDPQGRRRELAKARRVVAYVPPLG
jgi:type II secretory pathway pseudopilin PulG